MEDLILFISVFIGAYVVSMGVLYVAFRVFFPVVVEIDEAGSDIRSITGNQVIKLSRDSRINSTSPRLQELPKIKLVHG